MQSFLHQVALRILADNPTGEERTLVVFNNHRSIKFLHREFSRISMEEGRGPMFVPDCMVIDEVVQQLGGMKIVQNEFLLFELYKIHTELGGENRKYTTFEDFIAFGELMMADFAEVDQYRVDARQIFVNLYDMKSIGEWNIEGNPLTPFQRNYLEFYRSLYNYYCLLRQRLAEQGEAYSGMAYRAVADHIEELAPRLRYDRIYFVGFNALTACEQAIIDEYIALGRGHLLTDGDAYYFNERQEAGYFLWRFREKYAEIGHYGPSLFGQGKKHITIADCSESLLQCKYAGQVLAEHPEWLAEPGSTAVVLADESLMIPMLNSLPLPPAGMKPYRVNISMGYAYADSSINSLALKLLRLYRSANPSGYYHRDLTDLLSDFYVGRLADHVGLRRVAVRYMAEADRIRCKGAEVRHLLEGCGPQAMSLGVLFPDEPPSADEAIDLLDRLAMLFIGSDILENNKKEQQSVGGLAEVVGFLRQLQSRYHYIQTIDTLEKVYSRIARHHNIAFLGEPLEDLQLLGMLETRNLDFKRVILLSANEGVLPAGRTGNTLIPFVLKNGHMPTYYEKDNIFAYHFYRLIQRAEEVYLLYSSAAEAMGKGEPSRFVRQVESELVPAFGQHITLERVVVSAAQQLHTPAVPEPSGKSQDVLDRLAALTEKGLSPSAINSYLNCPMQYYYTYVMGLRESELPDDDIDTSQLGTAVHNTLCTMYSPFVGRRVDLAALREARQGAAAQLEAEFHRLFEHGRTVEGRNTYMLGVAQTQLRAMLDKEIATLEAGHSIEIVGLEEPLECALNLVGPGGKPVRLRGYADRIDRIDGHLRVIDYKTGGVKAADLARAYPLPDGADLPSKWMQLMCYALMYVRSHTPEPVCSAIYPLRYTRSGLMPASWGKIELLPTEMIDEFEALLCSIIGEMINPEEPFAIAEKPYCAYCPARGFCPDMKKVDF